MVNPSSRYKPIWEIFYAFSIEESLNPLTAVAWIFKEMNSIKSGSGFQIQLNERTTKNGTNFSYLVPKFIDLMFLCSREAGSDFDYGSSVRISKDQSCRKAVVVGLVCSRYFGR